MRTYHGHLWAAGPLGSAFFVSRKHAVTAFHCVEGYNIGEIVEFGLDDHRIRVKLVEVSPQTDLALLERVEDDPTQPYGVGAVSRLNAKWRTPTPHYESTVRLHGKVREVDPRHRCLAGGIVEGLQLKTEEYPMTSYEGFSGSAVEKRNASNAPMGMIFEEVRAGAFAANVIFATTVATIQRVFSSALGLQSLDADGSEYGVGVADLTMADAAQLAASGIAGRSTLSDLRSLISSIADGLRQPFEIEQHASERDEDAS